MNGRQIAGWFGCAIFYLAVVVALGFAFELDVDNRNYLGQAFSEQSYTEMAQVVLLALTALLIMLGGRRDIGHRPIQRAMTAFFLCLAIRETDHWLDRGLFDGSWQIMVSLILLARGIYLWQQRDRFAANLGEYLNSYSAGMMLVAILVMAFSRVFARKPLWYDIMGEKFTGSVKNAVEEGLETLSMVLMLMATVEYLRARRREVAST